MKSHRKFAAVGLLTLAFVLPSFAEPTPDEAVAAVRELFAKRQMKEANDRAKQAVKDVDPAKTDLAQAQAWCDLYTAAKDYKGLRTVAERWLETAEGTNRFRAQTYALSGQAGMKDSKALARTISAYQPATSAEALRMASSANSYVSMAFENNDRESAKSLLATAERLLNRPLEGPQAKAAETIKERIATTKKLIQENPGKEADALHKQQQEALKTALANGGPLNRNADIPLKGKTPEAIKARSDAETAKFAKLIGQPAAALKATKALGELKDVPDLKGKVVVLDFFAHWCGPCKAALPSLRTLNDDLKSKGLEVISVTKFQGYYGLENRAKKDMSPDAEYERMKGFIKDQKINWPVAFVSQETFDAYMAKAIPHVVVIDRAGKVHRVKVGYYPTEVEAFHKEIEALLKG